jgi:hypothetical protein
MRGNYGTVEPRRAEQFTVAGSRVFDGLSCFNKNIRPSPWSKQPLDGDPIPFHCFLASHLLSSTAGRVRIQNSARAVDPPAFLPKPSLAMKLLKMISLHPIQTDKYED